MTHLPAVQHAQRVHTNRHESTREALINEAVALGEWGVYSKRQVASFTGLRPALINDLLPKSDRTGGTLKPESLGYIIILMRATAREEDDCKAIADALKAGVSSIMLARLTGRSQSTLSRRARSVAA